MAENKWDILDAPPPPMFVGKKERDFVKEINDEIIERITGQQIIYYPISLEHTNYHPLYGEAVKKTFLPPVHIYALIQWDDNPSTTTNYGVDHLANLTVHFHKRRLTEDQDLFAREGDFIAYGNDFYEIMTLAEPRELFGQNIHKVEVSAKCVKARRNLFDAE